MTPLSLQQQLDYITSHIITSNNSKLLFIVPESAGDIFLSTSLLRSIKELYNPVDIYFACKPEYSDILKYNPYITKTLNYMPVMENQIYMEGSGKWPGLFDVSIMTTILTQRFLNYLNNGNNKIAFDLRYKHAST